MRFGRWEEFRISNRVYAIVRAEDLAGRLALLRVIRLQEQVILVVEGRLPAGIMVLPTCPKTLNSSTF